MGSHKGVSPAKPRAVHVNTMEWEAWREAAILMGSSRNEWIVAIVNHATRLVMEKKLEAEEAEDKENEHDT